MNKNAKITDFSMLDEYEVQGIWWLPSKDENKDELSGNLYSKDGEIYLDLLGNFSDFFDDILKYEYIHGFTIKGEKITLINSFETNSSFSMPGLSHQSFMVNYFIVGDYFTDLNQTKFKSAKITSTYLTKWFNSRPFSISEGSITYTPPEINTFYIPILDAEIKNLNNHKIGGNGVDKMEHNYSEYFEITPREQQNLGWFEDKAKNINRLLTLLINETTQLKEIILENDCEDIEVTEESNDVKNYHLYYSLRKNKIDRKLNAHHMLFTFQNIKGDFENIINDWFEKEKSLKNVYNLYFSNFFNKNLDLESKFLNAMQTLEVYHRTLGYGLLFTEKEKIEYLDTVNKAIEDLIPSSVLEAINKKIRYFNQYGLGERLDDIKNSLNDNTIILLFNSKSKAKSFINKVVNTRNYLTHYEENNPENVFKGIELFYVTDLLRILAGILIFKEIGIKENIILNSIENNNRLFQKLHISKSEVL